MRSGLSPKQFLVVMKKKPALQAILDDFTSYTEEQLESIQGQPLWIRKVLVEMKQDELGGIDDEGAEMRAEEIANMMMQADELQPHTEPETYEVLCYKGSDWYMSCGISGSMMIEVKYDDCLYVIDVDPQIEKYIVGMDGAVGVLTERQWCSLMQSSTKMGEMTKTEYSSFVSKQISKKMPKTIEQRDIIAKEAGPRSYVDPMQSNKGFEIIRHGITNK